MNKQRLNLKIGILEQYKTQKEFAEKFDIHIPTLSMVIRGRLEPSIKFKIACAKALNIPIEKLFA